MHVLVLSPWYPNPDYPLEGNFIQRQALGIKRAGLEVRVFHPMVDYAQWPARWWATMRSFPDEKADGLEVFQLQSPFPPRRTKWLLKAWANFCAHFFRTYIRRNGLPDLIHAHTLMGGLIALAIYRKWKIPYLISLHESSILQGELPSFRLDSYRSALLGAEKVLAVSSALAVKANQKFDGADVELLPNFIDTGLYRPSGSLKAAGPFRMVAIGDLIPIKQFEGLIEAFAHLPGPPEWSCTLDIAGAGPQEEELRRVIRQRKLEDRVTLRGMLSQEKVLALLRSAHLLVLSSRAETFGIVLVEAMACGLPVVATDCGGPADIVTPETGILVPPNDPAALAAAIRQIVETYDRYDPQRIRQHVLANFSEEVVIPKLIRRYEQALAR